MKSGKNLARQTLPIRKKNFINGLNIGKSNLKAKHLRFMAGKQNGTKFEMDETQRQSFENHIIKHIDKTIEIIKSNQRNKTINKYRAR